VYEQKLGNLEDQREDMFTNGADSRHLIYIPFRMTYTHEYTITVTIRATLAMQETEKVFYTKYTSRKRLRLLEICTSRN